MIKRPLLLALILVVAPLLFSKPVLIVTTTLISSAVQDLAGDSFEIETLMPAGTCPGQFDMEPRQAARVPMASLIIRHEMQGFLDRLFVAAGADPQKIVAPRGGFNVPSAYLAYCEKIARELSKRHPELAPKIEKGLTGLRERMGALAKRLREEAKPLEGTKVICALFQRDLAQWLSLDVCTTFPPTEDPSPAVLREAIEKGDRDAAKLVIGNIQNGDRVPHAIAAALKLPCVMLGNFPINAEAGSQEKLIESNVHLLLAVIGQTKTP